jgi:hypothetical protein
MLELNSEPSELSRTHEITRWTPNTVLKGMVNKENLTAPVFTIWANKNKQKTDYSARYSTFPFTRLTCNLQILNAGFKTKTCYADVNKTIAVQV